MLSVDGICAPSASLPSASLPPPLLDTPVAGRQTERGNAKVHLHMLPRRGAVKWAASSRWYHQSPALHLRLAQCRLVGWADTAAPSVGAAVAAEEEDTSTAAVSQSVNHQSSIGTNPHPCIGKNLPPAETCLASVPWDMPGAVRHTCSDQTCLVLRTVPVAEAVDMRPFVADTEAAATCAVDPRRQSLAGRPIVAVVAAAR